MKVNCMVMLIKHLGDIMTRELDIRELTDIVKDLQERIEALESSVGE